MQPVITRVSRFSHKRTYIFPVVAVEDLPEGFFNAEEVSYITKQLKNKSLNKIIFNKLGNISIIIRIGKNTVLTLDKELEKSRKSGENLLGFLNEQKIESVCLVGNNLSSGQLLAIVEGMVLGSYQFLHYRKDKSDRENSLKSIEILSNSLTDKPLAEIQILCKAVYACRNLVNEPLSSLNSEQLATEFTKLAENTKIKVEVLNKPKIEALKMGGLLAVNLGSIDPPTFTIMEYKPEGAVNSKPLVFVGKGIVYDTGGLSLKPTSAMDGMKADMSGAAAVALALLAIAQAELPLYVVALIPATDNRPHGNAYVPGDIITMMDGTHVEVLNTDAEGRLILADALSYAKKYKPLLVIDVATLTGAAEAALGNIGIAGMQNRADKYLKKLIKSGFTVNERIAEFPFWDDYSDMLKSEIADMKNVGGRFGGAITAGKFLQHFTDYPWVHLDIAGPSFLDKRDGYRTAGGTGVGVRLLFDFAKQMASEMAIKKG